MSSTSPVPLMCPNVSFTCPQGSSVLLLLLLFSVSFRTDAVMSVVVFVVVGHEDVTVALFSGCEKQNVHKMIFAFSLKTLAISRGFGKLLLLCFIFFLLLLFFGLWDIFTHTHTHSVSTAQGPLK